MSTASGRKLPLACVPGAIAPEERPAHFELIARLLGEDVRDERELADGYAFRFDAAALEDVARFVANERKCCPFLDFVIEVQVDAHDLAGLWAIQPDRVTRPMNGGPALMRPAGSSAPVGRPSAGRVGLALLATIASRSVIDSPTWTSRPRRCRGARASATG